MARAQRIKCFKIALEDKPGALLAVTKELKSKNLNYLGLSGWSTQGGQAEIYVVARNPDKLRELWKPSGKILREGTGFLVKGADKTGALIKALESLASAGINIAAIDAIAVAGTYGVLIWVADQDVEKAAAALGSN
ncbi:MAG TPA: hypothetical protein VEO56_06545 [Bacteroidota bacterium]|nr:hypothetical protein [Bacteroidota bacterium]